MKIALDAAGGDAGLGPNLDGAVRAVRELGVELLVAGPERALRDGLAARGMTPGDSRVEILPAESAIGMDEEPVAACREKPDASIQRAAEAVASGRASALVSAGPTGATMVAALWHLKRLPGVLRPAVAAPFPTARGTTVLLDAGANADCKPWHLLQFAMMGTIYARLALGVAEPSVGLLSNGEEESKGSELVKEALPLLKHSGLAFKGPVEGRDLPAGTVDVIVCDGFVGNAMMKACEALAGSIFDQLDSAAAASPVRRLGARLMEGALRDLKARLSWDAYGGAPLLGVDGAAVVCHGRSNGTAVFSAVRAAKALAESKVNEEIKSSLEKMKGNLEFARVLQQ